MFLFLCIIVGPMCFISGCIQGDGPIAIGGLVATFIGIFFLKLVFSSDKKESKSTYSKPSPPIVTQPPIVKVAPMPPPRPSAKETEDDITHDDIINNDIEFSESGIYHRRKKWNGSRYTYSKQRVYAYKRSYHLDELGKPRFHICRCATIDAYIRSNSLEVKYRKSTYKEVKVKNMDRYDIETSVSNLPLCQNCYKKMNGQYSWIKSNMDNRDFVEVIDRLNWG